MPDEKTIKFINDLRNKANRFNAGKLRYDLISQPALKGLASVLTMGAEKYGERNWEKGMVWSKVIASLKRHLSAIEHGEDYDAESGYLHIDHLQANAHFLSAYYTIYPQGDDRLPSYLNHPKIGLDIDGVICDWQKGWCDKFGYDEPNSWSFSYSHKAHYESFTKKELEQFYLNLDRLIDPKSLPFEPHCYITARSIDPEITKQWIQKNGFPTRPLYCVPFNESKVELARKTGIEVFVDDKYDNFVELNNAGIFTYLMTTPQNIRYNVGHRRINSLNDLPWFKK